MKFKPMPRYTGGVVAAKGGGRSPVGRMFIQPMVEMPEGRQVRLDDALGTGFAVLGYDADPAAHLAIGTLDPLLDDNERLAAGLAAAGVPCRLIRYDGLVHGYIRYGRLVGSVRRAIADSAAALRAGLMGGAF